MKQVLRLGNCRFELLRRGVDYLGLGKVCIGRTLIRSGRLAMSPYFETFTGLHLCRLRYRGLDQYARGIVIRLEAELTRRPIAALRDHSFDPIHDLHDWGGGEIAGRGELTLILELARETIEGTVFDGFRYHYEYRAADPQGALYWIMDRSSWELDGNIVGTTAISQSACSPPEVTFAKHTTWSTEGNLHFLVAKGADENPVMTHNLPRFASHGSFDFQFKQDKTLIGVFKRVGLIRSVLCRDAGKPELKTFDKHIFDQAVRATTVPKGILLNTDPKTITAQKNLWTWTTDLVHSRARAEFGLREEPLLSCLAHIYWSNFTIATYYKDLLPAARTLGFESVFVDNLNKSDMTERVFTENMCCGHEYEPAETLGGKRALKKFVRECARAGIADFAWTNNDQSLASPLNKDQWDPQGWFVRMEDARLKYGGAYTNVLSILDFKKPGPRDYWVKCLLRIKRQTGLSHYLFDSFYNLGFMPVNYARRRPTTQWRELLLALAKLQHAGVGFMIESFGPFGAPQHGCHKGFAGPGMEYVCYKTRPVCGYSTVPTGEKRVDLNLETRFFKLAAHMVMPPVSLFYSSVRVDKLWSSAMKQVLHDYHAHRPLMHKRFLQEDGQSVLWHDRDRKRATLWNFADRTVALPGSVHDAAKGERLPRADRYHLKARHTYVLTGAKLPVSVGKL